VAPGLVYGLCDIDNRRAVSKLSNARILFDSTALGLGRVSIHAPKETSGKTQDAETPMRLRETGF